MSVAFGVILLAESSSWLKLAALRGRNKKFLLQQSSFSSQQMNKEKSCCLLRNCLSFLPCALKASKVQPTHKSLGFGPLLGKTHSTDDPSGVCMNNIFIFETTAEDMIKLKVNLSLRWPSYDVFLFTCLWFLNQS